MLGNQLNTGIWFHGFTIFSNSSINRINSTPSGTKATATKTRLRAFDLLLALEFPRRGRNRCLCLLSMFALLREQPPICKSSCVTFPACFSNRPIFRRRFSRPTPPMCQPTSRPKLHYFCATFVFIMNSFSCCAPIDSVQLMSIFAIFSRRIQFCFHVNRHSASELIWVRFCELPNLLNLGIDACCLSLRNRQERCFSEIPLCSPALYLIKRTFGISLSLSAASIVRI